MAKCQAGSYRYRTQHTPMLNDDRTGSSMKDQFPGMVLVVLADVVLRRTRISACHVSFAEKEDLSIRLDMCMFI